MTPDPAVVRRYEDAYAKAVRREARRQWLLTRLDVFTTACARALGYCAALALLVWASHHGLI